MKISPLDIHQKQFQKKWQGLNPEEVTTFLDMVRSEMEGLLRDNAHLKENLRKAESALDEYREREKSLKDTLMMAQKVTEDIKSGALKEAEIVLSEARIQAEQIVTSAHGRLGHLSEEIRELKGQRTQLLASLRATIETHSKLLEITEKQGERRDAQDEAIPASRYSRIASEKGR